MGVQKTRLLLKMSNLPSCHGRKDKSEAAEEMNMALKIPL